MKEERDHLLEALKTDVEIPEIVRQKADDAFRSLPPAARAPQKKRITKRMIILASVILLLGTISVSAGYLNSDRLLYRAYHPGDESTHIRKILEEKHLLLADHPSTEHDGIKVSVKDAIIDRYSAHISFNIEGLAIPENQYPSIGKVELSVGKSPLSGNSGFYAGDPLLSGNVSDDPSSYYSEDGSLEYYVSLVHTEPASVSQDRTLKIAFTDLGYTDHKAHTTLASGTWEINIPLDTTAEPATYPLNESIPEIQSTVTEIQLSPISLSLSATLNPELLTDYRQHDSDPDYAKPAVMSQFLGLLLKDGTILPSVQLSAGLQSFDLSDGDYQSLHVLGRIIDPDTVQAVLIPKSDEYAESSSLEDFYVISLPEDARTVQ